MLGALAAFPQQDSIVAAQYISKANECIERNQPDSARAFHRNALSIYKKMNRLDWWHKSYISLAFSWADVLQQPFEAEEMLTESLNQAWREPKDTLEWEQVVRIQMYQGYIYQWYIADFVRAAKHYEESFGSFVKHLGEHNDKIAGFIYHQLGNIYSRQGDYARAESLLRRGIEYGEKNKKPEIGKYGDLAIALLDLGKNKEALEVIKIGLNVPGADEKTLITERLSEARAWLKLGNRKASLNSMSKVPPLVAKLPTEKLKAYYLAGYHGMSAVIQDSMGNANAALVNLQKAIRYEVLAQGTAFSREAGKAHCALGEYYLRQKKIPNALHEFQQALQSVLKGFKPSDDSQNPASAIFEAENTIIEALLGKARAFRSQQQLEKALECYELIPIVETKLRATHAYESSSLLALDESRHRFDEAINIAWMLYATNQNDRRFADRAFRLTEQARGMLLLQSLAQAQAKYQLPESIRQREGELNVKIAWYEHEIAAEREAAQGAAGSGDPVRLARLGKELFDLKQANENFKSELRQRFPEYAALSDEIHFLTSTEVPSMLRSGQALLDFYLTDQDVFIFSFDEKGSFSWRKAALPIHFRESVLAFVQYLQKGDEEDKVAASSFRSMANGLYELLLAPELNRLMPLAGSLLIIPDDVLVFVPFEVLLRRSVTEGNWRDLPWLLADYNTGYAYSATLLQMQQNISRKHRERKAASTFAFGGFAPSYSSTGVYKLTSTELLVNNARQLLGGKTWCGAEASEANFKKIAPNCSVLLLAMHGLADAENPELSRLLFGDPGVDTIENDNVLYASELQIMQLQADLAVLSACHSGFGKLQKGEGVFSLARAFARAGVPATVMSLWLLHENTAAPLVQSFLQYLQAGKSKDEALRLAKLDFLKDDKNAVLAHPFYWAGVTTSGDMCGLELGGGSWFSWW